MNYAGSGKCVDFASIIILTPMQHITNIDVTHILSFDHTVVLTYLVDLNISREALRCKQYTAGYTRTSIVI